MAGMFLLWRLMLVIVDGSVALKWVSTSPLMCVFLILRYMAKVLALVCFICHELVNFTRGEIFCLG